MSPHLDNLLRIQPRLLQQIMSREEIALQFPAHVHNNTRQTDGELDAPNNEEHLLRARLAQPGGNEVRTPPRPEILQHQQRHSHLQGDVAVRIDNVRERRGTRHNNSKRQQPVAETGYYPVQPLLPHRLRHIPEGKHARDGNESGGDDKQDPEFGLVDVFVETGHEARGTVGERTGEGVGDDGADEWGSVHVPDLLGAEVSGRAGEELGEDYGDGNALREVSEGKRLGENGGEGGLPR